LLSSAFAVEEARRNLTEADQLERLGNLLKCVTLVPQPPDRLLPARIRLPDKDRPILIAALEANATHLITGDLTHFGPYFGTKIGLTTILPPAEYLARRKKPKPGRRPESS
jgi:hypothetical protein